MAKLQVLFKRWTIEERIATDFAIKCRFLIGMNLCVRLERLFSCKCDSAMLTNKWLSRICDRISLNVFTHLMRLFLVVVTFAKSDVKLFRQRFILCKLFKLWSCGFLCWFLLSRRFCDSSWSGWRGRLWIVIVIEIIFFGYVVVRVV